MPIYELHDRIDIRNVTSEQFVEEMARRRNVDLSEIAYWVEEQRNLYKNGEIHKRGLTIRQNKKFSDISDVIYRGMTYSREFLSLKDVNRILRSLVDYRISH